MLVFAQAIFTSLRQKTASSPYLITALLVFCSFFGFETHAEDLNEVRLQLRWHHQFQFAGYYAAIERGYYEEAGLKVALIEGGAGKNTIDEVVEGNAEYGVTNSEVLLHRLNGKPLVLLASIFQHSPLVFISRAESGITTPQQLSGKYVKMSRNSRDIELHATLHNEGVNFDQFILLEGHSRKEDYFNPDIDALAAYITNQPFYLKQQNIPFNIIKPSSYGVDFYGDCLFTTQKEIQENPDRVSAFKEATLRGWEYALANPVEIVNLLKNKYKTTKSREHLIYEAQEMHKLIMPDLVKIGHTNPGRWQHIAGIFHQFGLVPDDISIEGFIYSAEREELPAWLMDALWVLAGLTVLASTGSAMLFLFNRRLQKEVVVRRAAEEALLASEKKLLDYSRQTEQFSLSAASILSIRDEKTLFTEISKAIVEHSDFKRVLISLFKEQPPYRELIGFAGVSEEVIAKVRSTDLSKNWFDDVFSLGIKLGRFSYYIPHTMKEILNQEAVIYGSGELPAAGNQWHPEDNLFVRMNDENGEFIGIISVDSSKSGLRPTDEVVRPLEIYASLISQIIILKREHTRRHKLEQQLRHSQKMEALGNLTGGIAHDFNNILGIIIGNAELAILDTPEWNPTHHNLAEIKTACQRAKDIVQHLLIFSRKSDNELRPVRLSDVLQDSIGVIRSSAPPNIELDNQIELGEETVLADPAQIYQVLINLCSNSVHAMEPEGGKLTLAARPVDLKTPLKISADELPAGKYVRIDIKDTGHGIDPDLLEKIFDPYYTTKEFGKGTGLGLSIVHGIIQSHNGAISVSSFPERETVFTLYLPITARHERLNNFPEKESQRGTETIMLVDDDASLLKVGKQLLEKLGYDVVALQDPARALDLFQSDPEKFNLLITDMTMPNFNGTVLAERVLKIRSDIPIFLCTGYSDKINEEEATRIGITRYFEKPLDAAEFAAAISCVLKDKPHC